MRARWNNPLTIDDGRPEVLPQIARRPRPRAGTEAARRPAMPIETGRGTCSPLSDEYKLALRLGNTCVVTQRISVDDHWRLAWGIARSLWIYYRSAGRR